VQSKIDVLEAFGFDVEKYIGDREFVRYTVAWMMNHFGAYKLVMNGQDENWCLDYSKVDIDKLKTVQ
jgi:hypothetical protein